MDAREDPSRSGEVRILQLSDKQERELIGALLYHASDPGFKEIAVTIPDMVSPADFMPGPRRWIYAAAMVLAANPDATVDIGSIHRIAVSDRTEEEIKAVLQEMDEGLIAAGSRPLRDVIAALPGSVARVDPKTGRLTTEAAYRIPEAISARDLLRMRLPPVKWLVDKILTSGLCMIIAPPKSFKSYMALDLAISLASGGSFLGFKCHKMGALYLDLESSKRRPQTRLRQILQDRPCPDGLYLITAEDQIKRIGEGLEEQIKGQLKAHPEIGLVCIDVLQVVKPPGKRGQNAYESDYATFDPLKKLATDEDICILLIHHMKKGKDGDIFNQASGSTATLGAMDCSWALEKERGEDEGTLYITGRDIEARELRIKFDKETMRWECLGSLEDVERQRKKAAYDSSVVIKTVKNLIAQGCGHWEGAAADIQTASQYFDGGRNQIYQDPRAIGREIAEYKELLLSEGYVYSMGTRRGKERARVMAFSTIEYLTEEKPPEQVKVV